jgi:hypothetical protein
LASSVIYVSAKVTRAVISQVNACGEIILKSHHQKTVGVELASPGGEDWTAKSHVALLRRVVSSEVKRNQSNAAAARTKGPVDESMEWAATNLTARDGVRRARRVGLAFGQHRHLPSLPSHNNTCRPLDVAAWPDIVETWPIQFRNRTLFAVCGGCE